MGTIPQSVLDQQDYEAQRMAEHQRRVAAEALGGPPAGIPQPNPYQDMSGPAPTPPKIGLAEMLMKYLGSAVGNPKPQPTAIPQLQDQPCPDPATDPAGYAICVQQKSGR